ncbi:MAG: methionyl-tRNA formyltransferase [Lentisphaeria bacterium]
MNNFSSDKSINPLRVYFMGTGDIAVPVLNALFSDTNITLLGVCTQPDRRKGRKKELSPSPIGEAALKLKDMTIDKPNSVNSPDFINYLTQLNLDFIVVMAFGQLLKQSVLDIPRLGCINLHASILPKYRGASPINAALLSGDCETGISIMKMEAGLDSGPVHSVHKLDISLTDNYATLQDKLALLSAEVIAHSLMQISNGEKFVAQNESNVTHVGKIHKDDGIVDWNRSATDLERMSRAYFPWPGLHFFHNFGKRERKITLVKAKVINMQGKPGTFIQADKSKWIIACGKDSLLLELIIPDGSREMSGADFLKGVQQ